MVVVVEVVTVMVVVVIKGRERARRANTYIYYLTCIALFDSHNHPKSQILLSPFYRWE